MLRRPSLALALALVVTLIGTAALADERDEARELAQNGVIALQEGNAQHALDLLRQAESKFHAPTNLLYIARALVALERDVEAHRTFVSVLVEDVPNYAPEAFHKARSQAEQEAAALLAKVATVQVEVVGPDASAVRLTIDGEPIGARRLAHAIALDAGSHTVEASAPGFETSSQSFEARVGETAAVRLELEATRAEPTAGTGAAASSGADEAGGSSTLTIAGGVLLGIGGAALVVGAVTGGLTLSKAGDIKDNCNGTSCPESQRGATDDAKVLGNVSTAMLVIGGALAATGVVLVIVEATSPSPGSASAGSEPSLALRTTGMGVWLDGRF